MAGGSDENELSVRKRPSDRAVDEAIARIAGRQKRLVRLEQLRSIGLESRSVQARAASGHLHRLHRTVYATHGPPFSIPQKCLAAVYSCGAHALLSGFCAAANFSLVETFPNIREVTNATGAGRRRSGIVVRESAVHPRDAIPCTSVARTIIDCAYRAGLEGTEDLILAADSAQLSSPISAGPSSGS